MCWLNNLFWWNNCIISTCCCKQAKDEKVQLFLTKVKDNFDLIHDVSLTAIVRAVVPLLQELDDVSTVTLHGVLRIAASSRNPPKRVRRKRLTAVGILAVNGEEDVKTLYAAFVNYSSSGGIPLSLHSRWWQYAFFSTPLYKVAMNTPIAPYKPVAKMSCTNLMAIAIELSGGMSTRQSTNRHALTMPRINKNMPIWM